MSYGKCSNSKSNRFGEKQKYLQSEITTLQITKRFETSQLLVRHNDHGYTYLLSNIFIFFSSFSE
jgi:hypothetical protein